jgi:predicted transcriptional regulator
MEEIWVRDCMTREVVTCSFDTLLEEVVTELHENSFSCLIISNNNKPIGIITERDLVSIFSNLLDEDDWKRFIVADYMRKNPKTVYEDLTLSEAVEQMRIDGMRSMPVVNSQGEIVGILTQTDVVRGFYDAFKSVVEM